jgi:hypothetical protein
MLKFLARKRMCGLFRGQEEKHRDIHEDLFGQLVQQLPDRGLPCDAVHPLKVRVDNAQANGYGVVPTAFNLCLRVQTFIGCEEIQNLLDLPIRLGTPIVSCHAYNRPSAQVIIAIAASTKACASCAAMVPGVYRMSVDQEFTRAKWGTTDAGSLAPPCSAYSSSSHS